MQQKSNKNASVKSGKRSVHNSTSATNKRKKSMAKRKTTTNQMNFSNIQQNQQLKFNQATAGNQLNEKQYKKQKKQGIMSMGLSHLGQEQKQRELEQLIQ